MFRVPLLGTMFRVHLCLAQCSGYLCLAQCSGYLCLAQCSGYLCLAQCSGWHNVQGTFAWHNVQGTFAWHNVQGTFAWHNAGYLCLALGTLDWRWFDVLLMAGKHFCVWNQVRHALIKHYFQSMSYIMLIGEHPHPSALCTDWVK